jgi:electron transfer flavoprotein-quinone oxidoreductase
MLVNRQFIFGDNIMVEIPHKYDIIVIGAGPAGSSAAYTLAKMGYKVLVLERGRVPGSKNMFGGRVYTAPLREIYPDFEKRAPIHRWVIKERISILHNNNIVSMEYESDTKKSFTTYLTQLSAWMAKKAEDEGATILTEITVDKLHIKEDKINGVLVGDEILKADVVIDCEGVNRLILEKSGIIEKLKPEYVALGVKEVIKVDVENINKLFGLENDEGIAWILMGDFLDNTSGGAFIYTNRDSISLGIVVYLGNAVYNLRKHISKYIESLRLHPLLYKYFKDGRIMEYSSHLIPEDISKIIPKKLYHDGLLIAGDAAGLLLNIGYTYRGVDYAAYSGYLAAKAVDYSYKNGGPNIDTLAIYQKYLEDSFIMRQLKKFRGVHDLMKNERLFREYPILLTTFANKIFESDYEVPKLMEAFKESKKGLVGWITLVRDLLEVSRKL